MTAHAFPVIDAERCTGCGRCVAACPPHVIWLDAPHAPAWGPKHAVLHDPQGCTGCARCAVACPFDVIRMVKAPAARAACHADAAPVSPQPPSGC